MLLRNNPQFSTVNRLVSRAVEGLLVRILEGEGGGGAVLPGLRAEVVVEARAGGHRLGVEVSREGAVLPCIICQPLFLFPGPRSWVLVAILGTLRGGSSRQGFAPSQMGSKLNPMDPAVL